jgi:hypothetical protein
VDNFKLSNTLVAGLRQVFSFVYLTLMIPDYVLDLLRTVSFWKTKVMLTKAKRQMIQIDVDKKM